MKKYLKSVLVLPVAFSLLACQSSNEDVEEVKEDKIVEKEEVNVIKTFGKKSASAYELNITNSTKQIITYLSASDESNKDAKDILEGESIDLDEHFIVYVEPEKEAKSSLYSIHIKTKEGKEYDIEDIDLAATKKFSICVDKDTAYITVNGKKVVSKKAIEKEIAEQDPIDSSYYHAVDEDLIFPTFDQASSYAMQHLDSIYKKYQKPVKYYIEMNDKGQIVLKWYVQDLIEEITPEPELTPIPVPDPIPEPTPVPVPDPTPDPTPVPDPTPDPTPEPEPVYDYVPAEDMIVSSWEEGQNYGNANLMSMYQKYGKPVYFTVTKVGDNIVVSWYVQR